MKEFKIQIIEKVTGAYPSIKEVLGVETFENPKNSDFGDIALPCFKFAGILKMPPVKIAENFSLLFTGDKNFEKIVNINGYLNFKFNREEYIRLLCGEFRDGNIFNKLKTIGNNKTIVIDYSHPNIAKNMGIHNLRSTIIGQSIYNIHKFLGYNSIGVNHLGDWGTQFGKLMWALEEWSSFEEVEEKGILFLNDIYVRFHSEAEKDPCLEESARIWFKKLENNDHTAIKWWKLFIKVSMDAYDKIYERLNVKFDYITGESFYIRYLDETIKKLEEKNLTEISEGALVVKFDENENMPPCLLRKSDGATLYATRDISAAMYRLTKFKPYKVIYVTDIAQELHFNQVFKVIEMYDPCSKGKFKHVKFGRLSFSDMQMSTRKGNIVPLNEVLDKARDKAIEIIKERNAVISDKAETADKIGIGAVIFNDLSVSRIKNIEFDWDKTLSFEGETGPHIQYSFVRILNILEKIEHFETNIDYSLITDEYSYDLLRTIEQFENKIIQSCEENEPSVIANYLLDLSKTFNRFYQNNRVVGVENDLQNSRAFLIKILQSVYAKCMDLLGIPIIDKM
ncbi:MAG: arginine--tRNA ligase [Candidatus Delongbacteria bacterium]|nr:arginine--tRNA ligase [Candidatus Delongbacteria bacterium]MCG2760027.1 arginine--tRNA ligase [Candidatus Delongbacteria bacterium]